MIPSATTKERINCGILQLLKKELIGFVCAGSVCNLTHMTETDHNLPT